MRASKENAEKAIQSLKRILRAWEPKPEDLAHLEKFLISCKRELPCDQSIEAAHEQRYKRQRKRLETLKSPKQTAAIHEDGCITNKGHIH